MKRVLCRSLSLSFVFTYFFLFLAGNASSALVNGDFSNGLTGWTTSDLTGSCSTSPSQLVTAENGFALLETGGFNSGVKLISLSQTFSFPVASRSLLFDIGFWTEDNSDTGGTGTETFPDFFQVTLIDEESGQSMRLATLDQDGLCLNPKMLSAINLSDGWFRIAIEATDFSGRSGTLFFDLSDQDDSRLSRAGVDNVHVQAVPLPATWFLFGSGFSVVLTWARKRRWHRQERT